MTRYRRRSTVDARRFTLGAEDGWAWFSGDGGRTVFNTEQQAKNAAGNLACNCGPVVYATSDPSRQTIKHVLAVGTSDWVVTDEYGDREVVPDCEFVVEFEPAPRHTDWLAVSKDLRERAKEMAADSFKIEDSTEPKLQAMSLRWAVASDVFQGLAVAISKGTE